MPRLLLEGKSITALLAQVRAEYGDDVTIVAAEKVRSGGLGGFFAKESYALTVEVGAPIADTAPPTAPVSPIQEQAGALRRAAPVRDAGVVLDARSTDVQAPGSLLDLAAAIDEAEATENSVILATRPMHASVQEPMLSTASPEFASILARLTALDAPQDGAEPASTEPAEGAVPPVPSDPYTRLREALAELAPHLDLPTDAPVILILPPPVADPGASTRTPAVQMLTPAPAVPEPPATTREPAIAPEPATTPPGAVIPRQGRHRRGVGAELG